MTFDWHIKQTDRQFYISDSASRLYSASAYYLAQMTVEIMVGTPAQTLEPHASFEPLYLDEVLTAAFCPCLQVATLTTSLYAAISIAMTDLLSLVDPAERVTKCIGIMAITVFSSLVS